MASSTVQPAPASVPLKFKTILDSPEEFKRKNGEFVAEYLSKAKKMHSPSEVLSNSLDEVRITDGAYLEFGVFTGNAIKEISNKLPHKIIHGFDSFEGLPETWERADMREFTKGFFSLNGVLPSVPNNIRLYKGWFSDSFRLLRKKFFGIPL